MVRRGERAFTAVNKREYKGFMLVYYGEGFLRSWEPESSVDREFSLQQQRVASQR